MNLDAPIINAPMGGVAGGELAAAVSRAGALGMIGIGSSGSAARLREHLGHTANLQRPFGIGLISWVVEKDPALLDTALAAGPALMSVSFGQDWSWVRRAQDAGCVTAVQVADLAAARRAVDAGVEVLVARGAEGGGHGRPAVATLPLLAELLDALPVPVLAAGGIASGRALAAVLAAGAAGAWIGTAFAVCPESTLPAPARQRMLDAGATDTVTTRAFDVALGYPWPAELPERVLRNAFTDAWDGRVDDLDADARALLGSAIAADDYRWAPVNAGQGVGEVTVSEPAAVVVGRLVGDARRILANVPPRS
ncbi:nitronate monooxygenase [Mycobacterium sp. ITM-2016-00317]|uniref:NAD(P)H-dependent flavin oxidoreductase n=1 Tax=Mycobacterium sp. ITM-2016-00317 TaxID=2099694 RepID=UPI00287F9874|nr:nitronate monooxygenase [Mycobacterium sp. ITM-2016-00317]WNG90206.1 nitronate monooxygenase [Mycobacterium sp. ITM-2016-00317]